MLSEFLDTFELHHSLKNPQDKDRKISLQEFTEYYTNISSTIDRDDYFELMITNAWNLNDKTYSKGCVQNVPQDGSWFIRKDEVKD